MIVKKRKFDIRHWVLVTNWNPLTIWIYGEPYIRFPSNDYNPNDITDVLTHLTNNSIGKNDKSSKATYEIPGNMWALEDF
jgi:tubulin monoglycylase TTLL3/8